MTVTVEFLSNEQCPVAERLAHLFENFETAFFMVAYGTYGAFEELETNSSLSGYLQRGRRLRVLFDADRHFTEPALIEEFIKFPGDVECRLYAPRVCLAAHPQPLPSFHAKIYYFENIDDAAVIIGSNNFTKSGLKRNYEAAVLLRGSKSQSIFCEIRDYASFLWNSSSVIDISHNHRFLREYANEFEASKNRESSTELPAETPLPQTSENVAVLQSALEESKIVVRETTRAYLLGLLVGGVNNADRRAQSITFELRRGELNRGSQHAGTVFFNGVSERGFRQSTCIRRDAERIASRLRRSFEELETEDTVTIERSSKYVYRIGLQFAASSSIWQVVSDHVRQSPRTTTRYVRYGRYVWPKSCDLTQPEIRRAFLQGYLDVRTRIAASDSLPQTSQSPLMRVAVTVGKKAPSSFPTRLRDLLAEEFGCEADEINFLDGAPRDRESIIRIDARLVPRNCVSP